MRVAEDIYWILRADQAGMKRAIVQEVLVPRGVHQGNLTAYIAEGRAGVMRLVRKSVERKRTD